MEPAGVAPSMTDEAIVATLFGRKITDTDRTIRVMCRKCWRRMQVSLPAAGVRDFCLGLRCGCGSSSFGVYGEYLARLVEMRDQ
jgi:hypothetical protein